MQTFTESKPELVCEVTAERVIAGRADRSRRLSPYTWRDLPPGAVTSRLVGQNIGNTAALRAAVGSALDAVGADTRGVILVVPDAAVRILLLDFETLPDTADEALPLLRFRLRKSVPFDVEQAALSFQAVRTPGLVRVVCAVSPHSVIAEYEALITDAGYLPGMVLPSTLAALGLADCRPPSMLLKISTDSMSLALAENDELKLFRSVEFFQAINPLAQLEDAVYPAIVFYEDVHQRKLEQIFIAGLDPGADFIAALEQKTGVRAGKLVTAADPGESLGAGEIAGNQLAAVLGAIAA